MLKAALKLSISLVIVIFGTVCYAQQKLDLDQFDVVGELPQRSPRVPGTKIGPDGRPELPQQKNATAAQDAAAAKAAAELAASQAQRDEAKAAAYELLLRLGDRPLQTNSFIVDKAWSQLVGKFVSPLVTTMLNSLSPTTPGESLFDYAETPREMKGARYLLEQNLIHEKQLQETNKKALEANEKVLFGPAPVPDLREEQRFLEAARGLASVRSNDAQFVVQTLLDRGRKNAEFPLSKATVTAMAARLAPITPANACRIPPAGWSCSMAGARVGSPCACPGIGTGRAELAAMSNICSGAASKCRMASDQPVGTPCNCIADIQQIRGPIPWGRVMVRTLQR